MESYTFEELMYEFQDRKERAKAEEKRAEAERDRIEEEKDKASLDWAEQEELRELAEFNKKKETTKSDEQWMKEQLEKDKETFGEDFGEDLSLNMTE